MRDLLDELAAALKTAGMPVIYGMGGITMEEQRAAVALARDLGGIASVPQILEPTLTFAGFGTFDLILTAGGGLPGEAVIKEGAEVIRDDRLLETDSWRCLASLFRGTPVPGAESFADLADRMRGHENAVFVLNGVLPGRRFFRTLMRFARELYDLSFLQIHPLPNALGAYEVMLEESGGASALFDGGKPAAGEPFAVSGTQIPDGADLLLRVGEAERPAAADIAACGDSGKIPCWALAETAGGHERLVPAVTGRGTYLRCDGVPVTADGKEGGPALADRLAELREKVRS